MPKSGEHLSEEAREKLSRTKRKMLKSKRFGRLIVLSDLWERNKRGRLFCLCQCDCGNKVKILTDNLNRGSTKSCGCLRNEMRSKLHFKHGDAKTGNKPAARLYDIWAHMKMRCYNPKRDSYSHYGGRGIQVCLEWLNNYLAFKKWALANGYKPGLTIDRIDNDGNYEPSNCQWITAAENTRRAQKGRKQTKEHIQKRVKQVSRR